MSALCKGLNDNQRLGMDEMYIYIVTARQDDCEWLVKAFRDKNKAQECAIKCKRLHPDTDYFYQLIELIED